jgi:RHS repeat-associated protein
MLRLSSLPVSPVLSALGGVLLTLAGGLAGPAWSQGPGSGGAVGLPPRGVVSAGVAVGTLAGTVSVGVSGGVSWTTGLKVVPGPGGVQPGLSIGYGGGGYGGMGVGFSLSGLSAISRCGWTLGQDDRAEAFAWTQDDRLCLDGERLVAVSGAYGSDGTEYRPRSAEHIRVIGQGASTAPGSGFTVYTPDGRVSEYGGVAVQATVLANLATGASGTTRVPLAWSIRTVRDRWGNRMDHFYAGEATGEVGALTPRDQRIERIDYGLNAGAGLAATRRVEFAYATVGEILGPGALHEYDENQNLIPVGIQRGYVAGVGYERRRVLNGVSQAVRLDGTAAWTKVREYELQYEAVPTLKAQEPPDQVRLAAMRECDGQENCLPDTRFEWSASPVAQDWQAWPGFAFDGQPFYPLPAPGKQASEPYRRAGLQVVGDFDADGVSDMLVSPEWVNAEAGSEERWELWRVSANAAGPLKTAIPAWSATEWVDRTGGVVVPGSLVQEAQAARTGRRRSGSAVASAWPANVDGTYGTDVLIGRPQAELAGSPMDPPWGYGGQTYRSRTMPLAAPDYCTGHYSLEMPGYTAEEVDKINWGFYQECEQYLDRSPADLREHPGIMSGFEVWRLTPGTLATFEKQDLHYPAGQPALWAQPADLDGDRLTDLVFCKAEANYAAVAGQALPMYYRDEDAKTNWVSGTVHYALNDAKTGLDLSSGGVAVVDANGTAQRCHLKDALYVLDLYGDGRESVLHRAHPTAGATTIGEIDWPVPAGEIEDPYPYDANDAVLTSYAQKLHEKMYAEWTTGASFYRALSWRAGAGLTAINTGLPYDEYMRWQGRGGGNASARYSRYMPSQASDVDATAGWSDSKTNRRVGWGSPAAPESGFGVGEARFADVNRDGLMDVLMVDLGDCRYATDEVTFPNEWPIYASRPCSYQDVMEFGRDLWEQTYEKLTVDVYANRGDGTFELLQSQRWWDTDLHHPQYTGKQLGDALLKGAQWANAEEKAIYEAAWTIATTATRQWRTEFASSQIGDGNGDGAADVAVLGTVFYPNGGWVNDTMAGTYVVRPQWRVGRLDGGLREEPAGLMSGQLFDEIVPANEEGVPPWANDGTLWVSDGKATTVNAYEAQEYGLPMRWQLGDFDRDGVEDAMLYDHVEGRWRFLRGQAMDTHAPVPQLLTAVVNGLGERTEVRYAPQHTLAVVVDQWSEADLTLPYPLISRPSSALVVDTLRRDSGLDAQGQGQPTYNSTHYLYGKSVVDVRRGVNLGIDRRETRQAAVTDSGVVGTRRIEVYDNTPAYDETLKAYPLAGTLVSETSWVSGGVKEPIHLSHAGYRYEAKAGLKAGTWRRQRLSSAAATYEAGPGEGDLAQKLLSCLPGAYEAAKDCALGNESAYQPLTQGTQWHGYDGYGYPVTTVSESGGATSVSEATLKHQETLAAYVLGLPAVTWVAHEPSPGAGYTVRTTGYSYDPNGALKERTVEPERVEYRHSEELKYDAFGNVIERWLKSDVGGWQPTFYQYSPSGVYATAVKNAKGHATTSAWSDPYYEACERAERVTGPAGHTAVSDIDTFCRTTGEASYYGAQPLGPKVNTSYAEWDPDGAEEYKDVDLLVTTSVAGGASRYAIADRLGRNVVNQGPGFGFEVYEQTRYDVLGRAQAVSLPTKAGEQPAGWTTTKYDALGRARQVTAADGTVVSTAIDRYRTMVTDALGQTSTSTMNALGQVERVDPPWDPAQPLAAMCYRYGAFGVLTEAAPCAAVPHKAPVTFQHDDYGRVTQVTSAATGVRKTQYDQLGRVWRTTDAKGQATRFVYDDLGRLTARIEADGTPAAKTATWLYDTVLPGALTEARNADGTVVERPYYDGYRRVAGMDTTIHGTTFSSRIDYDERGRVATATLPSVLAQEAVQVTTLYNGLDQPIGQSFQNQLLWEPVEANAFGQTVRQRYGNGLEAVAGYDPLNGRLATASVLKTVVIDGQPPQALPIEQFDYAWYDNGLLERRTRKGLLPNVTDQSDTFYYTPRGELSAWTTLGAGGAAQAWKVGYDGYGNLVEGPAGSYDYGFSGEQLQSVKGNAGTVSYQYDGNGNVKVRDHNGVKTVIDYDALNRIEGIQDGSTQSTWQLTYSADGTKVHAKETGSGRETFYLGGYQRERGGKLGTQVVERMNLGPAHVRRSWAGNGYEQTLTYLTPADHLGSLTLVTDGAGLIEDRRSHGVWGAERDPDNWIAAKAVPADDAHGVAAGYTGHERAQRAPGLIDMNARYYDTLTQRLVQADTVIPGAFNPLAWNGYAYAFNNPVAYTDPSGHAPQGGGGGGGGGGSGRREFTPEQNLAAMADFMAGMEGFGNGYAAANGLPSLGGNTGAMLGQGGIHALRAIHLVRTAVKLGEMMVADHAEQMRTAPREHNQDRKLVALFDRDWWGFVRAGKVPPFRTVDQYRQWLGSSPEARAALMSSEGMYAISQGHVGFVWGQMGANAGAIGANGLRNARGALAAGPGGDTGDSEPAPEAPADDALDAAAAAGGPGGPKGPGGGKLAHQVSNGKDTQVRVANYYRSQEIEYGAGRLAIQEGYYTLSEARAAHELAKAGHMVVLRQATGNGRTSDLLVNGVRFDVYNPVTTSREGLIRGIAGKGTQVNGGGVVVDVTGTAIAPQSILNQAFFDSVYRRSGGLVTEIIVIKYD